MAFLRAHSPCRMGLYSSQIRCLSSTRRLQSSSSKTRIGCASGFWGDTNVAIPQLVKKGNLDFLVMDYLSEITMSLLVAMRRKVPELGFVPDFVRSAKFLKNAKADGLRVVTNAGGINPLGCAKALDQALQSMGTKLNIAVVTGDDITGLKDELIQRGCTDMYNGMILPESVNSMTAYLGAGPISRALELGADIVVTGRCTDSALVLGPLMHKYGWDHSDYDKLAAGSLAGHLVECGAQSTGGVYTDWQTVPMWENIGFPVVECSSDGAFLLTKPPGTGGLVSVGTVSEQMLYEIDDPAAYKLPDVCCDFSHVTMTQSGEDEVSLSNVTGSAPSESYKISTTYADGFRVTGVAMVAGRHAAAKARRVATSILNRVNGILAAMKIDPLTKVNIQIIGSDETYGKYADPKIEENLRQAGLWMAIQHHDKKALEVFATEIAAAGTGMAPGLTGMVGGRPKVSPVFKLFSFLHPKDQLEINIHVNGDKVETYCPPTVDVTTGESTHTRVIKKETKSTPVRGDASYRLSDLALARSGDKGNNCNIGVVGRTPEAYRVLKEHLTADVVREYFSHVFESGDARVDRYDVPGISALNFVLHESLGGGGVSSLRTDPQGKGFAQMILDLQLHGLPENLC